MRFTQWAPWLLIVAGILAAWAWVIASVAGRVS